MRSFEFYMKPAPGECAEAAVSLPAAQDAVIFGHVTDTGGPVEGALVLLLEQESRTVLSYTVTDALGQFWFGPLSPDSLYLLRIQKLDTQTRIIELTE